MDLLGYENRLVLFLDILGFKGYINESIQNYKVFESIYQAIDKIHVYQDKFGKFPSREVTSFSDSIVISYPIHNSSLRRIFQEIRDIVLILLEFGFVCRGGVGIGELYHKGSVVFGPAMIEAYELESKHAIFPRIIIRKEDIDKYNLDLLEYDLKEDDDGYYYFNIFNFFYTESGEMMDISRFIKNRLEEIIKANIINTDESIRAKYEWLAKKLTEGLKRKFYFVPVEKAAK